MSAAQAVHHHGHHPPMHALPYRHVDGSLRALAGQAEGFGRHAIGGFHGPIYHVTSLADDGHGSLREGCRSREPLWIVFEISGTIHLEKYLRVASYKTIDGRGQRVKLAGKGLQLKECEHIIVCNLEFEGGRGHDIDGIQIKPNSRHIWIDRCSLRDYDDGLIDVTRASTDITISRCYFSSHDKTMLIGADNTHTFDRCIRVTIHHCFFDGTIQRHPRLRYGKVHLYNNYTRNWGIYAVCASVEAQILSQCNIYEAGAKTTVFKYFHEKMDTRANCLDALTKFREAPSLNSQAEGDFICTVSQALDRDEACSGWIRSEGDLFLNGAKHCLLEGAGVQSVFRAEEHYPTWTMEPASLALKEVLQICAGWKSLPRPLDIPPV